MMKYATLVNGRPSYHGIRNPIINADGSRTVTKNEALLLAAGFLPVRETPMPDEGEHLGAWEITGSEIVRVWTTVPEVEA